MRNAHASFYTQKQQQLKSEEAAQLITFVKAEELLYEPEISIVNPEKFPLLKDHYDNH